MDDEIMAEWQAISLLDTIWNNYIPNNENNENMYYQSLVYGSDELPY